MDDTKYSCPKCKANSDEQQLLTVVETSRQCPSCRFKFDEQYSESSAGFGKAGVAQKDLAAIQKLFDAYQQETGQKVVVRPADDEGASWVFGSNHSESGACECEYFHSRPGVIAVQFRSKIKSDLLFSHPAKFTALAYKFGVQVNGRRGSTIDAIEGVSFDAAWWVEQYLGIAPGLKPALLVAVVNRLAEVTKLIEREAFGPQ